MIRKSRKCVVTEAGQAVECFHLCCIERTRREDLKVSYLSAHVPWYLTFDADDTGILQGQMFVKPYLAFSGLILLSVSNLPHHNNVTRVYF